MNSKWRLFYVCCWLLVSLFAPARADLLVSKQVFELPEFTTFGGKTIKQVRVGWESYGNLNADKSNVVLITHFFSGNSHAAGKYSVEDQSPGYWDAIIGPGKSIDTQRYFVISVDSLVNLGVHDPHVITTGPATLNPDTGKPYGMSFPVVTIRDFVNLQKAVLSSLGITQLHAVVGASMGSLQAIDWAVAYPDWVPRMISVIGSASFDAWSTAFIEHWAIPIRLDPNWRNGNYYDGPPPNAGLVAALMQITQHALSPGFFNQTGSSAQINHAQLESAALQDIHAEHRIVQWLRARASARAGSMDANHLLYLVRANQLFIAGHANDLRKSLNKVKAKTLFIPSAGDLLLQPYHARNAHQTLLELGKSSSYVELDGGLGHLDGLSAITSQSATIQQFLDSPVHQGDSQ